MNILSEEEYRSRVDGPSRWHLDVICALRQRGGESFPGIIADDLGVEEADLEMDLLGDLPESVEFFEGRLILTEYPTVCGCGEREEEV